jgi:hypothetical protein
MKKHFLAVVLVLVSLVALQAQGPPQQQMKPEDVQKALSLVDKPVPAPEKYKAGLEAITANDSVAMLAYLSSDLLEGRETATRGYSLAAEYAASLFKLWGVKPAGDMPMRMGGFRMGGGRGQAPQAPRERTYFQDFALRETTDTGMAITIETNKAGGQDPHLRRRPGLPGRFRGRRRHRHRARRLRRLRHLRAVGRLRRAQRAQPQGQDRPRAERRARP